jgi:hypothetical protein
MLKDEVGKKNQLKRTTKVKTNNSNKKIWIRFDRKKNIRRMKLKKKLKLKIISKQNKYQSKEWGPYLKDEKIKRG